MSERFYKIGELARRTGITVRTLHHYDAIGLLKPLRDPANGHRLYGREQLERLLRILALSRLGLSLADIGSNLDAPQDELSILLREQIARLKHQLEEQHRLLRRLEAVSGRLERGEDYSARDLLEAIEVNMDIKKYFTADQLQQLETQRQGLGEDAIRAAEQEWPKLIAAMRSQMERSADPADPEVAKLARRWQTLVQQFSGGDPAIEQAVGEGYREEPGLAQSMGLDADLFRYAAAAVAALKE